MTTVLEIERAVSHLPKKSFTEFRSWFHALEVSREKQEKAKAPKMTMAQFLDGYVGTLDSQKDIPGGAQLSRKSGKDFTAGLRKKAKGRL